MSEREELDAMRDRADKATKGPWRSVLAKDGFRIKHVEQGSSFTLLASMTSSNNGEDSNFAAHARTDLPRAVEIARAALARAEAAEKRVAELESFKRSVSSACDSNGSYRP